MTTPVPQLADELVRLRVWSDDDIDVLVAACNDPDLRSWLDVPVPYEQKDAHDYIALCRAGWEHDDQFTFAIVNQSTGLVAGSVRVGPSPSGATAGYWIAPWARGAGMAAGALQLVTAWAFSTGFVSIRLYISPENHRSRRVALNAGYRHDEHATIDDPEGRAGDSVYVASF